MIRAWTRDRILNGSADQPQDDAGSSARAWRVGAGCWSRRSLRWRRPLAPTPQDPTLATLAPKFGREDRILDWTNPAVSLVNLVRALSPEPAATTTFRGDGVKVFKAEAVEGLGEPGRIVEVSKRGIVVATAEGGFRPLVIGPAGRRVIRIEDFVNGFRPEVGERLG
jgi:methionyl-tRNA formyltransferase